MRPSILWDLIWILVIACKDRQRPSKLAASGQSVNPFSTETVLLVGYLSPITYTLIYTWLFI